MQRSRLLWRLSGGRRSSRFLTAVAADADAATTLRASEVAQEMELIRLERERAAQEEERIRLKVAESNDVTDYYLAMQLYMYEEAEAHEVEADLVAGEGLRAVQSLQSKLMLL